MSNMRFTFKRKPRKWGNIINYVVIFLLFAAAICGMTAGITSQVVFVSYNEHNIFNAVPTLIVQNITHGTQKPISSVHGVPTTTTTTTAHPPLNESLTRKQPYKVITHIYKGLNDEDEENSTFVIKDKTATIHVDNEHDYKFLTTTKIDYVNSSWGSRSLRGYIIFYPFVMAISAIIWSGLLLVFRTGPVATWGLPKPWRIVVPSILFLTVVVIATLTYIIIVHSALNSFCEPFREHLYKKETSCVIIVALFRTSTAYSLDRLSDHVHSFLASQRCALIFWVFAYIIMILRCVFVIDFQLAQATISIIPTDETETTELKFTDKKDALSITTAPPIISGASTPPNELMEEEEFYSANSILETNSQRELTEQSTSLQPLIRSKSATSRHSEDFV